MAGAGDITNQLRAGLDATGGSGPSETTPDTPEGSHEGSCR